MIIMPPSLEKIINKAIKEKIFPGVVVGVKRRNDSPQFLSFGNYFYPEDPLFDKKFKVGKETIFDIASLTKIVTVSAIFILVSRENLSLNDEIDGLLKTKVFKGIKIRHLLSHVSGLRLSLGSLKEKSKEEMERIILSAGPATKPAEAIWYADQGYYLLGKIIEIISKKSLDVFFKEEIFLKLKMKNTVFNPPPEIKNKIAPTEDCLWRNKLVWGEVHTESAHKLGGISGYAGLFSTAEDLIKIGSFWLNGGEGFVDKDLIDESKKCLYPNVKNETLAGCCHTLGGWRINDYRITGKKVPEGILSLTGFTGPTLMIDYSKKLAVAIAHSYLHPKRKNGEETKLKNKYHALVTEEIYKNL